MSLGHPAPANLPVPGVGLLEGLRVADLVDVPPVRTVVRLADLRDGALRDGLTRSFVLTGDCAHALCTILGDVAAGRGRGYFLEGNYGAGKSHLMAVLGAVAAGGVRPPDLGAEVDGRAASTALPLPAPAARALPVPIALVDHAARVPLEEIVRRRAAEALGLARPPAAESRREAFAALAAEAQARGYAGLLLCLDELSEFLRAKPDGRAFVEDARCLQFLGEWAEDAPAWVVLAVQEAVEDAGALPAALVGGLRDRFPVRFRLGAEHVRELIARRLIRRRPGAEERLGALAADLRRVFGAVPGGGAEALVRLYPVHPLTVELLDRLKPLFSQRRGVVDFIASRLRGDPARRIPAWLEQPAARLLCPDALVDHFRDRARERPETAPLITRALEHFEHDLPSVVAGAEAAALGLRLGKVLVAGALCPTPVGFTAEELTLALLHRFTDLDPALNAEYVAEIAERMAAAGAYVGRTDPSGVDERGGAPAGARDPARPTLGAAAGPSPGPRRRRYHLDLRADLGPVLQARLDRWRTLLGPTDARLWTALLPWCDEPALPLQRLAPGRMVPWDFLWRQTPRQAAVWLTVDPSADLGTDAVRDALRTLELGGPDALLILAAGLAAPPHVAERLRARWRDELAPAARALHPGAAALLWLPRAPTAAEVEELADLAARALLADALAADTTETGARLARHLRAAEPERRRRAAAVHAALFVEGEVLDAHGNAALPAELGEGLPFSALLDRLLEAPLCRRFPQHPDLPPGATAVAPEAVARAAAFLACPGPPGAAAGGVAGRSARDGASPDPDAAAAIERLLVPLGLVERDARGWRLAADADACPHARRLLEHVAAAGATPRRPVALADAALHLRKGPGGLGRPLFDAVCLTLVRAGALSAVRGGRRLPPEQVTDAGRLHAADGLCAGALLPPDLRQALRDLPILPADLQTRPLTHGLQRQAWQAACAWRREWAEALPALRERAGRLRELPALAAHLCADRLAALDDCARLVAAVAPSLPPADGLARLLRAFAAEPAPQRTIAAAAGLRAFLEERADAYLEAEAYLSAPEFAPSAELAAEAHELALELADPGVVLGDGWTRAAGAFQRLRQAYAEHYAAAHAAAVGPGAFAAHEAVLRGAPARLARALFAEPEPASAAAALHRAAQAIAAAGCAVGAGALAQRLRRVPACACGFRPDRPPELPAPAALAALAAAAAAEAVRAMQAAGHPAAEALRGQDPQDPGAAERAVRWLLQAQQAGAEAWPAAADRDLAVLEARLRGRVWSADALLGAVRGWLADAPRVRVVRSPAPEAARRWEAARAALRAAAADPPASPEGWAALWLGPAGAWARRLEEAADVHPDAPLASWRAEAGAWAAALETAFRRDLPRWGAARTGLAPVGRALDAAAGPAFAFCVDALRCDLMEALLDEVAAAGLPLRASARGVAWAVAPTVTAAQFEAWAAAGWDVQIARQDAAVAAAVGAGGRSALLPAAWSAGRWVCKWDFLDTRLHAGDAGDYATLVAEFRLRVRRWVLPALAALAPGDTAVLFGDHGFRRTGAAGYAHGGDAPDEVLAPWCALAPVPP